GFPSRSISARRTSSTENEPSSSIRPTPASTSSRRPPPTRSEQRKPSIRAPPSSPRARPRRAGHGPAPAAPPPPRPDEQPPPAADEIGEAEAFHPRAPLLAGGG